MTALVSILTPGVAAADAAATPPYTLRVSGSPVDRALIDALWVGYERAHPGGHLETKLYGPDSTLSGVYTDTADIALMARETREPMERMAFEWAMLTRPTEVEIATAGLEADRPNAQLAVFVQKDNPIASLSMTQLDAILSAQRKRGGSAVDTWGALDVGGAIQSRKVHLYGAPVDEINALFVRRMVMGDSRKWNPDYHVVRDDRAVVAAIAQDRLGVGIAPWRLRTPGVRAVPIVNGQGQPVALSEQTAADRSYPLVRAVRMIVYKPKDKPIEPVTASFLRYVLSPAGQAIIAADGTYLPLSPALADAQAKALN